ncbi:hypothetical protein D1O30_15420 [Methylocystis hirsuta]|uniref:Uncharacterized protein n=1 Tax=Methylocystis hirsuta TaxID=369798 RepID=A0A3M9XR63_9HYPH|nr:hypothetical protein D1O30_15420 [Methylocystis hirsuta]
MEASCAVHRRAGGEWLAGPRGAAVWNNRQRWRESDGAGASFIEGVLRLFAVYRSCAAAFARSRSSLQRRAAPTLTLKIGVGSGAPAHHVLAAKRAGRRQTAALEL